MRGVWFLGFCCATLALTSGSHNRYTRQEPICLVYSYDTLANAMRNVHAHYAGKHAGIPGRNYNEGVLRYSSAEFENGRPDDSGVSSVRKAYKAGEKKNKRSVPESPIDLHFGDMLPPVQEREKRFSEDKFTKELKPIEMDFGDMVAAYEPQHHDGNFRANDKHSHTITCTEHVEGKHINLELPIFLETLLDVKQYFDQIFP